MVYNKVKEGSKMFKWATFTANYITGCHHRCIYNCWARKLMMRQDREFEVHKKVQSSFVKFNGKNERIATNLMGDAFCTCDKVPYEWVAEMFGIIRASDPSNRWLLQTKNPRGYLKYLPIMPPNVLLGVTIESDIDYMTTRAPAPEKRFLEFLNIPPGFHKFLSIEPVMKFNVERFSKWILQLRPEVVEVGADNYGSGLKEPSGDELLRLVDILERANITVNLKSGLERLMEA